MFAPSAIVRLVSLQIPRSLSKRASRHGSGLEISIGAPSGPLCSIRKKYEAPSGIPTAGDEQSANNRSH
jgi:hypothetical protein